MFLYRSGADWEVRAPAKLNLRLEVFSRRIDGFHELETLMVPVTLFDTLYFAIRHDGEIRFDCQWSCGDRPLPTTQLGEETQLGNENNLVVRAVRLLRREAGIEKGASMRLVKRIPTSAGLGGGSSDAAAALVVANRAWDVGWPLDKLCALGAELGSDVPFFFASGAAICRGRGERVEPVGRVGRWAFVVVSPPDGLSTADVFRRCQPASQPDPRAQRSSEGETASVSIRDPVQDLVQDLVHSMRGGRVGKVGGSLYNRLQSRAEDLSPWVGRCRREFDGLDCVGHQMTGSGTSYFGLCRHARHARIVAGKLQTKGIGRVFAVHNCN